MNKKLVIAMLSVAMFTTACSKEVEVIEQEVVKTESTIDVFGQIKALDKHELYIDFTSIVKDIHIEEGQRVSKDTPLFTLEYGAYERQMKEAEKRLELAIAELDANKQGVGGLTAKAEKLHEAKSLKDGYLNNDSSYTLKLLENKLSLIKNQILDEEKNYDSLKQIYEVGGVTQNELDKSKLTIQTLKKDQVEIEKAIIEFKDSTKLEIAELGSSIASVEEEKQTIESVNELIETQKNLNTLITQLQIDDMKEKLESVTIKDNKVYTDLENAIVEEIICEEGEYLGIDGPSYCVSLLDADSIQVVADVPEEFIKDIYIGQKCKVTPYYDKGLEIGGEVQRISEIAIKKDGEVIVQVYVKLLEESDLVLPGFSVDISFEK